RNVDLSSTWDSLFQRGGFPPDCLPQFLHELVHHWCFLSVVGSGLACLETRARLSMLEPLTAGKPEREKLALEDVTRYETDRDFFRPLAEGLALFAEYDVLPYFGTNVISKPMQWLYLGFVSPAVADFAQNIENSLRIILGDWRLSDDCIRRKALLLMQPLDC